MARNKDRDRLIQTFISRSRSMRSTPNVPAAYRPQKQGTGGTYRPVKRTTRPARY